MCCSRVQIIFLLDGEHITPFINHLNLDVSQALAQTISFILVGILIATSIRGFLQIWLKIFQLQNAAYSVQVDLGFRV
jgi:hypothetical protein